MGREREVRLRLCVHVSCVCVDKMGKAGKPGDLLSDHEN